jgi:predicted double-glycine peptidase
VSRSKAYWPRGDVTADLLTVLMTIASVSMVSAWLGLTFKRRWSATTCQLTAALAVIALLVHAFWLVDNLLLARLLPVTNVIAWANIQTPAMAFLAGLAWAHLPGPRWQKILLVCAIVGIGTWRFISPYVGETPAMGPDRWTDGICRQSTKSTCSAASAATVLAAHGIAATEAEMTGLCLTRTDGTPMLGLFRGMKAKTTRTAWDALAFSGTVDDLRHQPLPAVITITVSGLPGTLFGPARHSTVVFGFPDADHVIIGDPYAGRQRWTIEQLQEAYLGSGVTVVRR